MLTVRTDLAVEAHALWRESAGETTRLKGVAAREEQVEGMTVTRVEILDQEGARALGGSQWARSCGDMTRAML